jgi:hypothetical protein
MNPRIKPLFLVVPIENYRHSVVDFSHELIGRSCQDREGPPFVGSAGTPGIPYARDTHDRFILKVNLEWALSFPGSLPLVKSAERNDASLPQNEVAKERAFENRLAPCINR